MEKIIFKKASYDYKVLRPAVFDLIDAVGNDLVKKNTGVLIKPNLLLPASPEKAITTHPLFVRAVAEYVLEKGGIPLVADSPAMGSLEKIKREGGYDKALQGLNLKFKTFTSSVKVNIGEPFGFIDIAKDAIQADVIFNLPKLKTHTQMLLTLGVKNMFGCIVGLRKPQWHLRSGVDREMFAKLLVQICNAVKPSLTLVDGILAMEGQGPGKGGKPRYSGLIVGGKNAIEVDRAICSLLGLNPDKLPTHQAAKKLGLVEKEVHVNGYFSFIMDFKLPHTGSLSLGPKPFHKFMRRHFIQRPVVDEDLCRLCGQCSQYCPAKAINQNNKTILFDYDRCIRCYCCIEICPHGALCAKETLPGKILDRLAFI